MAKSLIRLVAEAGQASWYHLSSSPQTWIIRSIQEAPEGLPQFLPPGIVGQHLFPPAGFHGSHEVPIGTACRFASVRDPGIGPDTFPTWLAILNELQGRLQGGTLEEYEIHPGLPVPHDVQEDAAQQQVGPENEQAEPFQFRNERIVVRVNSVDQWRQLIANPELHWRIGYSARTLAHCWSAANGLPQSVQRLFAVWGTEPFDDFRVLLVRPELKVSLAGLGHDSQTDAWVLGRNQAELISISVEGKVDEPFGDETLAQWLADPTKNRLERLGELSNLLGIPALCNDQGVPQDYAQNVRYQLLHRTASAIKLAKVYNAQHAMLLVHSFSEHHTGLEDYKEFLALFGAAGGIDKITFCGRRSGIQLWSGWVCGEPEFKVM